MSGSPKEPKPHPVGYHEARRAAGAGGKTPSVAPPPPTSPSQMPPAAPPSDDERFMEVALTHAKNGKPSPNPHVGAVVVSGGEVVGTGHHERAGTDHAEIGALRAAGPKAKGASPDRWAVRVCPERNWLGNG